jgi:hypothetical protein
LILPAGRPDAAEPTVFALLAPALTAIAVPAASIAVVAAPRRNQLRDLTIWNPLLSESFDILTEKHVAGARLASRRFGCQAPNCEDSIERR